MTRLLSILLLTSPAWLFAAPPTAEELAAAHALAALKHHFYDRDNTLRRMTRGH